uniref:DNA (cytosine-5-)-methyltransferase n=1 Tax=uncultured prokaryote TaxID=198431 RepID=A0A0H5QL89_9ZZZZ|nr:hypothetical protein [uncultured prokaryote]
MHKTNHPHTVHYQASVWDVDPEEVCAGRPVGLAWFSPDCKHFSKAKGGKPVDKNIRGLAWIALRWAGTVRPRVIILENVEEFQTWGPVRRGRPVKSKTGQTFRKWVAQLEALGYTVEWRELVAADYGAPTTRKRFFLIARCDGRPVVWPEPTHAPADSEEVKAGRKKPWRSASEIIDWSLPCPSIFDTREEVKEKYGLIAQRPLRPNTMRRVARGVDKFVIKAANPFIVPMGYGEAKGQAPRVHDIQEPFPTAVGKAKHGVCQPYMAPLTMHNNENATGTAITEPVNTITGTGAGGHQMLITPTLAAIGQTGGGDRCRSVEEPTHTQVSKAEECVVCPAMIQYHTEQTERVRGQAVTDPIMTIDASNRYGIAAASLAKYYGNDQHGQDAAEPMHTITAKDREAVTMATLTEYHGTSTGQDMGDPMHTTLSKPHQALQTAHMVKMKGTNLGGPVQEPVQTITASGTHHGLVITKVEKAAPGADLQRWPLIREALNKYCDYHLADNEVILFLIDGAWYFMADIGLRNAQDQPPAHRPLSGQRVGRGPGGGVRRAPGGACLVLPGLQAFFQGKGRETG